MLNVYLGFSVIIGLVVIYDGYLIVKGNGVVLTGQLAMLTSGVELLWVIASVVALFILKFEGWHVLIPVAYLAHNVLGWIYGILTASRLTIEQTDKVIVPLWYSKFGMSFGLVFTCMCALSQYQLYS